MHYYALPILSARKKVTTLAFHWILLKERDIWNSKLSKEKQHETRCWMNGTTVVTTGTISRLLRHAIVAFCPVANGDRYHKKGLQWLNSKSQGTTMGFSRGGLCRVCYGLSHFLFAFLATIFVGNLYSRFVFLVFSFL